jgi:predicted metal-dependent phosphoesterase TrpH
VNRLVDLHIHSSFSDDGDFAIADIFGMAQRHALAAIAITDHDTLDGISGELVTAQQFNVEMIPSVEITTVFPDDGSQQHILCYFADPDSPALSAVCARIRNDRVDLALERLHALKKMGLDYDPIVEIELLTTSSPTATTVVKSIFSHEENKKHPLLQSYYDGEKSNNRVMNFYRDFLAFGKPAFTPFRSIPTRDAVITILESGALPVLAHPVFARNTTILDKIVSYGVIGLEAYSSYHDAEQTRFYIEYAKGKNLLTTAGSDFHGPTAKPKVPFASVTGDYSIVDCLKKRKERQ